MAEGYKFHITAHPINRKHQEELGIYESGYVQSISVGRILSELVAVGHQNINSYVEDGVIHFHCSAKKD